MNANACFIAFFDGYCVAFVSHFYSVLEFIYFSMQVYINFHRSLHKLCLSLEIVF